MNQSLTSICMIQWSTTLIMKPIAIYTKVTMNRQIGGLIFVQKHSILFKPRHYRWLCQKQTTRKYRLVCLIKRLNNQQNKHIQSQNVRSLSDKSCKKKKTTKSKAQYVYEIYIGMDKVDSSTSLSSLEEYLDALAKDKKLELLLQDLNRMKIRPCQMNSKYSCTSDLVKKSDRSTTMSFSVVSKIAKTQFLWPLTNSKSIQTGGYKETERKVQTSSSKHTITFNKHFKMVKNSFFTRVLQFASQSNTDCFDDQRATPFKSQVQNITREENHYHYPCQLCSSDTLIDKHKRKKQNRLLPKPRSSLSWNKLFVCVCVCIRGFYRCRFNFISTTFLICWSQITGNTYS